MSRRLLQWVPVVLMVVVATVLLEAQTRRTTPRPPSRAATRSTQAAAELTCPQVLGTGLRTERVFCDVMSGRTPQDGILIKVPPHKGQATLTFDLHNRHTYSEDEIKAGRGYHRYTATAGVLTPDGTLLARGVVQSEFRAERDLLDRVGGGSGPGGVKAVAPSGSETVRVSIPENVEQVSILGERLTVVSLDRTENFTAPGRPIAVISNVNVEYQPAAKKKPPARRKTKR
jgi:hypothetical protein